MTAEQDALNLWSAAFVAAQADMPDIGKANTVRTDKFSYSYADLPSIIAAVRPVLKKHGLAFAQEVVPATQGFVGITTRIVHLGGHIETFGPLLMPANGNAQQFGSAISYARRYALTAVLGIAPDEDDDGQRASKASGVSPSASSPGSMQQQTVSPEERPAETSTDGEAGAAPVGEGGAGSVDSPASPTTPCLHPLASCTEDKPDKGGKYRAGFVRCTICSKVLPKNEAKREEPE